MAMNPTHALLPVDGCGIAPGSGSPHISDLRFCAQCLRSALPQLHQFQRLETIPALKGLADNDARVVALLSALAIGKTVLKQSVGGTGTQYFMQDKDMGRLEVQLLLPLFLQV